MTGEIILPGCAQIQDHNPDPTIALLKALQGVLCARCAGRGHTSFPRDTRECDSCNGSGMARYRYGENVPGLVIRATVEAFAPEDPKLCSYPWATDFADIGSTIEDQSNLDCEDQPNTRNEQ